MKTITLNIYEFSELSDGAKKKVLADKADINVFFDWWDSTYEDADNIGLKITSFDFDQNKNAKGKFTDNCYTVAGNIMAQHGKDCTTYITAAKFLEEIKPIGEFNDATGQSEDTVLEME